MSIDLCRVCEILERTPAVLFSLMVGLSEEWLLEDEGPGTFSPRDVLGHLIQGEKSDWIPRLRIILEHGESRPFEPFDREGFRAYLGDRATGQLLQDFRALRVENLRTLYELNLQPDQLALRGTHPSLGPVTIWELIVTWALHDLDHLAQIARVMAHQARDEAGPWAPHLRVLGQG